MDLEKEVREFIVENFLYGVRNVDLDEKDSFIEMGIVDSTGVLEIVSFIETRFGIMIQDDELVPENLDSVPRIVRYIQKKQAEFRE